MSYNLVVLDNQLIQVNLTSSWDWKTNISQTTTNITANPTTGSLPPLVGRGVLYQGPPDDDNIYLYGGTTDYSNSSFPGWRSPDSPTYSLWVFDTVIAEWSQYNIGRNAPFRPSSGAAAEAGDQSLGFYLNGELDRGSSSYVGLVADTNVFLDGMVVINITTKTANNISTAEINAGQARARAQLQYLPTIGEKGALVLLGGSTSLANELRSSDVVNLASLTISSETFDRADRYPGVSRRS